MHGHKHFIFALCMRGTRNAKCRQAKAARKSSYSSGADGLATYISGTTVQIFTKTRQARITRQTRRNRLTPALASSAHRTCDQPPLHPAEPRGPYHTEPGLTSQYSSATGLTDYLSIEYPNSIKLCFPQTHGTSKHLESINLQGH